MISRIPVVLLTYCLFCGINNNNNNNNNSNNNNNNNNNPIMYTT